MKILHFVRKSSQLKASFIYNQINSHVRYNPYIVFRNKIKKENDGGFADFQLENYNYFDLSKDENLAEKIRYKISKTLSKRQVDSILDFIRKYEIDICHFHYGTDCGVFYPLIQKLKIPSVVSFYGYDCSSFPKKYFGYGKRYLINRVFKSIDYVFAMSPDMKVDLVNAGCRKEKVIVHYYGTDCDKFFKNRNYETKNKTIILILASLVPQKGHLFLLRSIKEIATRNTHNFQLRIVGTGELEKTLKAYVKDNNLSDFVHFKGVVKYNSEAMFYEYESADIFVHPSVIAPNGDKEGIPGTIIEAMASGLPVVSTYHAGIPCIIENGKNGFLVKEWDVNGLSNMLVKLIGNCNIRKEIGLAGQKTAMETLNISQKEKDLENYYDLFLKDHEI